MRTPPLVSVIVPSSNSAKTIAACLESIKKQTYGKVEIVVVDKNSSDKTRAIAKRYTKNVYSWGPERAAQVNFGAAKASGKYLYRVDSDFIVEPKVIEECVRACEQKKLDGIAVHNTSAEGLGFWADVRKFERNTYIDDDLIVAIRFFTKTSWETVGGFDEALYGPEDYDFHNRFVTAGFRWGRIRALERHLGEPKTLGDIWRKHYYYGKQMIFYFRKHRSVAIKQFNPIRRSYLRHVTVILRNPLMFLGLITMTMVKFTAGGAGFFVALVSHYDPVISEAMKQTKRLYAGTGWARFFTSIRFWTGSFVQVETYVPKEGNILDLGCGYGIFANFLALCSDKRNIIGVDMDEGKIHFADRKVPNASFQIGDATKMHVKNLDAILLLDVLHHLHSYGDQEKLIRSCHSMLKPGGKLIILEVNGTPLWKLVVARVADAVLYSGQPVYYRYEASMKPMLMRHFTKTNISAQRLIHNPFPHMIYLCKK